MQANSPLKNALSRWERAGVRGNFADLALILTFSQREKELPQQAAKRGCRGLRVNPIARGAATAIVAGESHLGSAKRRLLSTRQE